MKAEIEKGVIERVGIIIDIDLNSEADRVDFINKCVRNVFPDAPSINKASQFIDLNFEDNEFQLACYFTNVDGQGELETVLKVIKSQESIYADCLDSWRECLDSKGEKIKDKDFDKFWIANYVRFDTCSRNDKKQADRKCNLGYALQTKTEVWNFNHPVLDDLKSFFELFS